MSEEMVDESLFVDASEFSAEELVDNDDEKESFGKSYSQKQVGSIAKYIEPVSGGSTIDIAVEMFREDPSLQVLPVEEYDHVVGIIERKTVEDATDTAIKRFMAKNVIDLTKRIKTVLRAKDYIEKSLSKISEINKETGATYFPVFKKRSFLGIVSLDEFLTRVSEIRERDLEKASVIQKSFFPTPESLKKDFKFSVTFFNRMANSLGGDIIQTYKINDYEGLICCLDVSGKNVSASLLTIAAASFFKILLKMKDKPTDPVKIISMLDGYLESVVPVGNFITGAIAYVDVKRHMLQVFNCGHTTTYLVYRNPDTSETPKVAYIEPKLPPFGMGQVKKELDKSAKVTDLKKKPYETLAAKRGIHLDLYSDGFTDMQNEDGFRYEDSSARNFFISLYSKQTEDVYGTIEHAVDNYIGKAMLPDDISVVDIRFDSILFL